MIVLSIVYYIFSAIAIFKIITAGTIFKAGVIYIILSFSYLLSMLFLILIYD